MIQTKTLWPLAILFLLPGCGSSGSQGHSTKLAEPIAPATIRPGEEATLLPAQVGNQWTFNAEGAAASRKGGTRQEKLEVTFKMTKVTDGPNGKTVEMEISSNDKVTNRQQWLINKSGIFQSATGMVLKPLTPPQPILQFPIKDGDSFKWTGVGPFGTDDKAAMTSTSKVKGSRLVDTEMGQVSAILVQSVSEITAGKTKGGTEISLWFKPGTGIVRLEQTLVFPDARQTETLRLKSFTPKNP